jgi:hypothetical protein
MLTKKQQPIIANNKKNNYMSALGVMCINAKYNSVIQSIENLFILGQKFLDSHKKRPLTFR